MLNAGQTIAPLVPAGYFADPGKAAGEIKVWGDVGCTKEL
jgi:hypothetical protein